MKQVPMSRSSPGGGALLPQRMITPGVSLGGGYRLKSGDNGRAIYHANLFWTGGGGVDAPVSRTVTAEVRVERQRTSVRNADGAVETRFGAIAQILASTVAIIVIATKR